MINFLQFELTEPEATTESNYLVELFMSWLLQKNGKMEILCKIL